MDVGVPVTGGAVLVDDGVAVDVVDAGVAVDVDVVATV